MGKPYDHWNKTGNQGDVVKHVALIAILDTLLERHSQEIFHYADTYAGYAYNPLLEGNEWKNGIGIIQESQNISCAIENNKHTYMWRKWYLDGRPSLQNGMYPGSSLIALDVCRSNNIEARLSLWDISPAVISNLLTIYGQKHSIHARPAKPREKDLLNADFLLIDPPVVNKDEILTFLKSLDSNQPFLTWLAINIDSKSGAESQLTEDCGLSALSEGYNVTEVRWAEKGRTIGCQLIHRLSDAAKEAMLESLSCIHDCTGWTMLNK